MEEKSRWECWNPILAPYAILLTRFLDGSISIEELELIFVPLYLQDNRDWPQSTFDLLDYLFSEIYHYYPHADGNTYLEFTEAQVRQTVTELLPELLAENFAHFRN